MIENAPLTHLPQVLHLDGAPIFGSLVGTDVLLQFRCPCPRWRAQARWLVDAGGCVCPGVPVLNGKVLDKIWMRLCLPTWYWPVYSICECGECSLVHAYRALELCGYA